MVNIDNGFMIFFIKTDMMKRNYKKQGQCDGQTAESSKTLLNTNVLFCT